MDRFAAADLQKTITGRPRRHRPRATAATWSIEYSPVTRRRIAPASAASRSVSSQSVRWDASETIGLIARGGQPRRHVEAAQINNGEPLQPEAEQIVPHDRLELLGPLGQPERRRPTAGRSSACWTC